MAKGHPVQTNFTGGEISPLMRGRIDVNRYRNGASKIQNCLVRTQGGVTRRTGTKFIKTTSSSPKRSRLLKFEVSDEQSYVLEFGAIADSTASITSVLNSSGKFRVLTGGLHRMLTGDSVTIYGSTAFPGMNGTWTITVDGSTSFILDSSVYASGIGSVLGAWQAAPVGYIHLYRNREPLFESTTSEIESFTVSNGGGLMQIDTTFDELPGWGNLNVVGAGDDNGEISLRAGFTNRVRVVTTVPHVLKTGALVYMRSNPDPNSIDSQAFSIVKISAYMFDLVGTSFVSDPGGVDNISAHSHGLVPGDRVFFSGGPEYPELSEQYHTVSSVPAYNSFIVANVPYVNHGTPTGEEVHCIPIEILTPYVETDLSNLYIAQSADVLYITHPLYPVKKLVRLDNDGDRNDWLLTDVMFQDGPYLSLNDLSPVVDTTSPQNGARYLDVYFEITNYSHTATVKSAVAWAAGTPSADQGKYLEYREKDQWGLALLTAATGGQTTGTVTILDNVLQYLDETTKLKAKRDRPQYFQGTQSNSQTLYRNRQNKPKQRLDNNNSINGTSTAGTLTAQYANTFGVGDLGKYIRFATTANPPVVFWAQIDGVSDVTGTKVHHSGSVTMVSNNATGKFTLSNEIRSATVTAFRDGSTFAAFTSTDVGRLIRLGFGGRWSWGTITSFVSTSQVTVTLVEDLPRDPQDAKNIAGNQNASVPNSGITYDWRLGAWSVTTGFPSCCVFHEQRLWFGRTDTQPQTLWGSISGDYENLSPTDLDSTVLDDSAIDYTITSGKVSPIKWMQSGQVMLVGGLGQEWQVRAASSVLEPITPTNIQITPQTFFGSTAGILPQTIGAGTLFVDRTGRKVRELLYNFELDRHVAVDVSIMSEHLFREGGGVCCSEYQKSPQNIYWAVLNNGTVVGMTYERDHEIAAWFRLILGGSGFIETMAVVSSPDGPDDVYFVVKRTINGQVVKFVEVMHHEFFGSVTADKKSMPFVDAYLRATPATPISSVTGLNYMEGSSVRVLSDGIESIATISSGSITLGIPASEIWVGFQNESLLGILPLESGVILGTAQTKTKRVNRVGLVLEKTNSFSISTEMSSNFIKKTTDSDFFSGEVVVPLEQRHNRAGSFFIKQDLIEPLNVLLVAPELATFEEQ